MNSNEDVVNFDHPLSRFYLKPRMWMWEAWQYGWKTGDGQKPDYMIGCYFSKESAIKAVEAREEYEEEQFGAWRFFAVD